MMPQRQRRAESNGAAPRTMLKATAFASLLVALLSTERVATQVSPLEKRLAEIAAMVCANPDGFEGTFEPEFLKAVPKAQLQQICAQLFQACGRVVETRKSQSLSEHSGVFEFSCEKGLEYTVKLSVAGFEPHRVVELYFAPPRAKVKSFEDVVSQIEELPGEVSFVVAELPSPQQREMKLLASHEPELQLALGSAFKLFILGALVEEIEQGKRKWSDVVRIRDEWKSLPSGVLHQWPVGSPVTLHTLATQMISISDNTATDHLLFELGRERVESMLPRMGVGSTEKTLPLLSTLEMFKLKSRGLAAVRKSYREADAAKRREILQKEITPLKRAEIDMSEFGPKPIAVSSIEWFASAREMALVMAWLRDHSRSEAGIAAREILAVNPGVPSDRATFSYQGFKGGSEPGVLNLTVLLETPAGAAYAVVATWNHTKQTVDEAKLLGIVQGTMQLLKKGSTK